METLKNARCTIMLGDCLVRLKDLSDNSVDSIVTDPPYGLKFMGKHWDYDVPSLEIWKECLRVLKPGGYLLAFSGTRTQHRMAVRIEDAGFEIRDMIAWVYGSGFPKSLNISKAVDKVFGAKREVIAELKTNSGGMAHISKTNAEQGFRPNAYNGHSLEDDAKNVIQITSPVTDEAKQWDGWGTALKPAMEPITVARKPLSEKTVAANVLKYGTGAINIDGCRVEINPEVDDARLGGKGSWTTDKMAMNVYEGGYAGTKVSSSNLGRWPTNFIRDGSEEVVALFPDTQSGKPGIIRKPHQTGSMSGTLNSTGEIEAGYGDQGSAARFFYCAKASKKDRNYGLPEGIDNKHCTVKPIDLMRYLCKLVTPPNGIVLDPFLGSGTTGCAAIHEGFRFIGIEKETKDFLIAQQRIWYVDEHV